MSQIDTSPASVDVGSLEDYPLGVDATAYVPSGATTSSAVASLLDANAGADYTATGIASSSLAGNVCTVTLHSLVALKTYVLTVLWTFSNGTELETRTVIKCPA